MSATGNLAQLLAELERLKERSRLSEPDSSVRISFKCRQLPALIRELKQVLKDEATV